MSVLCIIAIIMLAYPASGLWGLLRIPCTCWNGWFPEIFSGYWISLADETICHQYVILFKSVWEEQTRRKEGSDISQPRQRHVLLTSESLTSRCGAIALLQFINILSRWQGHLKTWIAFGANLGMLLLCAIRFAPKAHYSILDKMLILIIMNDV